MSKLKDYYKEKFDKHGVDEKSLGWSRNKQEYRFLSVTKNFKLSGASLIDIGCGFGDLATFAEKNGIQFSHYTGIDLMEDFVKVAKTKWDSSNHTFLLGNFMEMNNLSSDYVVACGIFGFNIFKTEDEMYSYVDKVISKALSVAHKGVSFDFISDKVDYRTSTSDFHASPSKILEIAYRYSKNVILDNSIMPFEFSLTVFKDNSFSADKIIFNQFLNDLSAN